MNVRKAARRCYKLLLFSLPVCLIISYSAAYDFTFKPCTAPPQKNKTRGHFTPFVPGRREPYSSATGSKRCTGTERIIQVQNDLSSRHKPITYLRDTEHMVPGRTTPPYFKETRKQTVLDRESDRAAAKTTEGRNRTRATIRYTIRDVILTCVRQPIRVSLIYRTETTTEK